MRLTVFLGVLAIGAGVAFGKLLHDRELLQSGGAPTPSASPSPSPARQPGSTSRRGAPKLGPLGADELRKLEDPKRLLAAGRFDDARVASVTQDSNASPALKASLKVLEERATLYSILTRGIRRHPFVNATDLVEVSLASGVTHIARVLRETDDTLVLALADGREIEVHQERILKRSHLTAESWASQERAALEKEKADLADAGSLEVFRLAFEAFERGFTDLGVPLLERALSLPGGGAVVDVYGVGDLDLLHRAQERLRADLGSPAGGTSELALARRRASSGSGSGSGSSPEPVVQASPEASEPDPSEPARPADLDRLEQDRTWQKAQASYSKAVAVYRTSFAGNSAEEKAGIRHAQTLLEDAQKLLGQLPQDMGEANGTIDTFVAKVNALLRDVKKRRAATGS
jgi:hypothetical protein